MTKQTIEVNVRQADGYKHIQESIEWVDENTAVIILRFEKIQPRRIVLEEGGNILLNGKWWHLVNENDVPLTKDVSELKIGDIFYTLPKSEDKSWRGTNFRCLEIREDCVIAEIMDDIIMRTIPVTLMKDKWEFKKK